MKNTDLKTQTPQTKTILTLTILSLTLITGTTLTAAQDSEQESDITVEIEEETIVDIQPSDLSYGTEGNLFPGRIGGPEEEQDDTGNLFIENLGSVDITNVWYETSAATDMNDDPFLGTGTNDASNFIALGSETDDLETDEYQGQFVDRKEYVMDEEDTDSFIFVDLEDGWNLGRLRLTNQEFFYAIDEVDAADEEGVTFRIGDEPRVVDPDGTEGQEGTTDLTTDNEANYQEVNFDADGTATVEISSTDPDGSEPIPSNEYCVKLDNDDGDEAPASVRFIQWNPEEPGCSTAAEYGNEGENLAPGDTLTQEIRLFVPFGVPADETLDGTLTIFAESE